jgi:2-dehydropantoate 2-reductase
MTMVKGLPPNAKSSMLEDLERGKRLELPWLSGAVVRIAAEHGIDAPIHRFMNTVLQPHVNGRR